MCGGVMWCPVTSAWNLLPKYFSGAGEIPQWIKFLPWKNMDMSWIPGTHKNVRVCFWSHVNVRVGETGARKSLELMPSLAYIVNSGQLEILCQKIHHMCVCVLKSCLWLSINVSIWQFFEIAYLIIEMLPYTKIGRPIVSLSFYVIFLFPETQTKAKLAFRSPSLSIWRGICLRIF